MKSENREIKFTHNWNNKLNCKCFTTIRENTPAKLSYFQQGINIEFDIILDKKLYGNAILRRITPMRLGEIPTALLCVDTGTKNRIEAMKIFHRFKLDNDSEVLVLLFEKK